MLRFSGGDSEVATPVPIPNTVVKHFSGDGTAPEKAWESSTLPGSSRLEPLARFEPLSFLVNPFFWQFLALLS